MRATRLAGGMILDVIAAPPDEHYSETNDNWTAGILSEVLILSCQLRLVSREACGAATLRYLGTQSFCQRDQLLGLLAPLGVAPLGVDAAP